MFIIDKRESTARGRHNWESPDSGEGEGKRRANYSSQEADGTKRGRHPKMSRFYKEEPLGERAAQPLGWRAQGGAQGLPATPCNR